MDVAVTELRAHLSEWLSRVQGGDEVVITERGLPVARMMRTDASTLIADLEDRGVVGRPASSRRPVARGRLRAQVAVPASSHVINERR
jgi:antitoxin (DNA-binding transcriptional repressor) of toxin-antitoxin stability system